MKVIVDMDKITLDNATGKAIIDFEDVSVNVQMALCNLKPKDEFKIGDDTFIVLEQTDEGTKVIAKDFVCDNMRFGHCSDWRKSPIRDWLNGEYYKKIAKLIGSQNIISMDRDLTSLDGLDDYDTCSDKITLLSVSEYAKYHNILGLSSGLKPNYSCWWWLITPTSTPNNDYHRSVCYVVHKGALGWDDCGFHGGVRPVLTLNSSILVSC